VREGEWEREARDNERKREREGGNYRALYNRILRRLKMLIVQSSLCHN